MKKKYPTDAIRRSFYLPDEQDAFLAEEAIRRHTSKTFILRELIYAEIERRKKLKNSTPKQED